MRKKLAPSQGKPLNPWTKKPKPSSHLMRRDPPPSLLIVVSEEGSLEPWRRSMASRH